MNYKKLWPIVAFIEYAVVTGIIVYFNLPIFAIVIILGFLIPMSIWEIKKIYNI